jgi:hypothetical protein
VPRGQRSSQLMEVVGPLVAAFQMVSCKPNSLCDEKLGLVLILQLAWHGTMPAIGCGYC